MVSLRNIVKEYEKIASYTTTEYYIGSCECIIPAGVPIEMVDVCGCLEDTLHRILDAGGTGSDVALIMGAYIPDKDEKEYTEIDLGYVIPGMITSFKAGGDGNV